MRIELRSGMDVPGAIVEAVAEATGQDPMDLHPLAAAIDTDAIESLFNGRAGDCPRTLTVEYEGCEVTVDPDAVTAEPLVDA